jgi:Putative addiction module component
MTMEQIETEALKLPRHVRARLAETLISSLDEDREIDRAWEEEAERRHQRYLAGEGSRLCRSGAGRDPRRARAVTPVVLLRAAQGDIRRAARFYEEEAQDLGGEFLAEIDHSFSHLSDYPELGYRPAVVPAGF